MRPVMCDEESLLNNGKGSIIASIDNMFRKVDLAIILLGEEDVSIKRKRISSIIEEAFKDNNVLNRECIEKIFDEFKCRTSQNVILELGYFWNKLDVENIMIVTTLPFSDINEVFEFPSDWALDLFPAINMNEREETLLKVDNVVNAVLNRLELEACNNYIEKADYYVNYSELLEKDDYDRIEQVSDNRVAFNEIAELWIEEIKSLSRNDERIIYMLERLVFFSYFPNKSTVSKVSQIALNWFTESIRCINKDELDGFETQFYNLLTIIKDYIEKRNYNSVIVDSNYAVTYRHIAKELSNIENNTKGHKLNYIIYKNLYDYTGLAYRAAYEEDKKNGKANVEDLYKSIESLTKCIAIIKDNISHDTDLWLGYSVFNRARSLKLLACDYENEHERYSNMSWKEDYRDACIERSKWYENKFMKNMPTVFMMALKAEYIYAELERITSCEGENKEMRIVTVDKMRAMYNELIKKDVGNINLIDYLPRKIEEVSNSIIR